MLDRQNLLSDAQTISGAAGTYVATNVIDTRGGTPGFTTDTLGNTMNNDPGKSPEVDILFTVVEAFTGGTSVSFQVGYDDAAAFSSPTILAQTPAIAIASLTPGYQARLALPPGQAAADIYLGAQYVTLGTMTGGKVTAGIVQRNGKPTAPGVFK